MNEVLEGISNTISNILTFGLTVLGIYATYEIIFDMGIPGAFSFVLVAGVFTISWFYTDTPPKQVAHPITIVDGNRANPRYTPLGGQR